MSENQIPAPIIATQNENETQQIEMPHIVINNAPQIPDLKPKAKMTIDDAIKAGANEVVIRKNGILYKFTAQHYKEIQQRQQQRADERLDIQRYDDNRPAPPPPYPMSSSPLDGPHNENMRLRNELANAHKSTNMWMGLARRMGRLRTEDRSEADEAIKRRDELQEARDTWIQKANENAKKVADLEKEITKLQKSNDYWQAQADKWHKQNDASVDTIQELKKENQEIKSKLKTEANKVQTLTSTMLMFRRKIDIALGEESK